MAWSREDALRVIEQVPAEAVRRTHINGSVAEATDQIQAYLDAGADYISVGNYVPMFETGKFGGGLAEDPKLEVYRRLRARNGIEVPYMTQLAQRAGAAGRPA